MTGETGHNEELHGGWTSVLGQPKDISLVNGEGDYKCENVIFSCREGPDKDGKNYKYSSQKKKWIFSHSFLSLIYCPKNKKTDDPLKC